MRKKLLPLLFALLVAAVAGTVSTTSADTTCPPRTYPIPCPTRTLCCPIGAKCVCSIFP